MDAGRGLAQAVGLNIKGQAETFRLADRRNDVARGKAQEVAVAARRRGWLAMIGWVAIRSCHASRDMALGGAGRITAAVRDCGRTSVGTSRTRRTNYVMHGAPPTN